MGCKWRWLRHPRTTQERRRNTIREELQFSRGKRRNLPTAWDDLVILCPKHECWKELRRTKWK